MAVSEFLHSNLLGRYKCLDHFITTACIKNSENESFNLSLKAGNINISLKNREYLAKHLNVDTNCLVFPDQCHTDNILQVTSGNYTDGFNETDALITNVKGLYIGILAADCVPVLLFDNDKQAVAAIHAGWKGTEKKIVKKTIEKMNDVFNSDPKNIIAYIGPSVCSYCYEVGEEVAAKFRIDYYPGEIISVRNNKLYLDLWLANYVQLEKSGVNIQNIEVSGICTFENTDYFFSARKNGFNTGRFAVAIKLK